MEWTIAYRISPCGGEKIPQASLRCAPGWLPIYNPNLAPSAIFAFFSHIVIDPLESGRRGKAAEGEIGGRRGGRLRSGTGVGFMTSARATRGTRR